MNYLLKSEPHRGLDLAGSLILNRFYAGFRVSLLEDFFGHDFKKSEKTGSKQKNVWNPNPAIPNYQLQIIIAGLAVIAVVIVKIYFWRRKRRRFRQSTEVTK